MNCPICLDVFTNPVVLPCGHSLCQGTCSQNLIKNNRITCPHCRSTHWVPDGESLPKNYDLIHFLQEQSGKSENLKCETHPNDMVTMFCTDCYTNVCVKCYIHFEEPSVGAIDVPVHKEHRVIPLDQRDKYIENAVKASCSYLQSKEEEETAYLCHLLETNETLQELINNKCEAIQSKTKKLKRMLSDTSRHHIELLRSGAKNQELNDKSCQSVTRLQIYSDLLGQCKSISEGESKLVHYSDIRRLMKSIDELPSDSIKPDPSCFFTIPNVDQQPLNDVTGAVTAITQCYSNTSVVIPSAPEIQIEDCLVGNESISVTWRYKPCDKVGYFTVYYETSIFAHGKCSDQTSIIVCDFGRSSGHQTVHELQANSRYRLYITASNEVGESQRSEFLYFVASSSHPDIRLV